NTSNGFRKNATNNSFKEHVRTACFLILYVCLRGSSLGLKMFCADRVATRDSHRHQGEDTQGRHVILAHTALDGSQGSGARSSVACLTSPASRALPPFPSSPLRPGLGADATEAGGFGVGVGVDGGGTADGDGAAAAAFDASAP
ncbi:hypothetical protein Vretimale_8723, partial [Volvox reticuliferus]